MLKIKVNPKEKNPRPYFPKELIEEGFYGEMDILFDPAVVIIINPKATLNQVITSLKTTQQILVTKKELRLKP